VAISTRPATADDIGFLREMLYTALYVREGDAPFPRSVLEQPDIAHYVDGFGRAGDLGIIGLNDAQPIGAAWLRLLIGENSGYGYVDDATPELTVALEPEWRGRGIGTRLMDELFRAAATTYRSVSLSCDAANPAIRLYERTGFQRVAEEARSITMRKPLP
jgi:ribosomal protein S18 acetylase RimI-like enzyme